jgi:hypothetical protein
LKSTGTISTEAFDGRSEFDEADGRAFEGKAPSVAISTVGTGGNSVVFAASVATVGIVCAADSALATGGVGAGIGAMGVATVDEFVPVAVAVGCGTTRTVGSVLGGNAACDDGTISIVLGCGFSGGAMGQGDALLGVGEPVCDGDAIGVGTAGFTWIVETPEVPGVTFIGRP